MKQFIFLLVLWFFTGVSMTHAQLVTGAISAIDGNTSSNSAADGHSLVGDVNNDNIVDISDIVAIIKIIANGDATENEKDAAVLAGLCPDSHHPHAIDLGVHAKWACCNVGSSSPEQYGGYYAWGETEEKSYYDRDTYKYYNSSTGFQNIGSNIASTSYDVAHVKWGGGWRMPGTNEIQWLLDLCYYEWITLNGVNGMVFTGPNGGKIFLPAAGYRSCDNTYDVGYWGEYRSSVQGPDNPYFLDITYWSDTRRSDAFWSYLASPPIGLSVRPVTYLDADGHSLVGDVNNDNIVDISDIVAVIKIIAENTSSNNDEGDGDNESDPIKSYLECPDSHHPHAIDLGIGVKWACCNVGATAPEQFGGYYAWGETEVKSYYDTETYVFFDNVSFKNGKDAEECFTNIGSDIAGTSYDVAHVKWGGGWRMPSRDQIEQLVNNCSSERSTLNGVDGWFFTGSNGGKIFLPAVGRFYHDDTHFVGVEGEYWTSTQFPYLSDYAYTFSIGSSYASWDIATNRDCGLCVRPVTDTTENEKDAAVMSGLCPDSHHPHAIDLGIGMKWACCNFGVFAPWEYGGYYAWGETNEKSYYSKETYKYYNSSTGFQNIGSDIAGISYDVAHVKWGGGWRMPSLDQIKLLVDNCSSEWTTLNGVNGMVFTGPSGGKIFLPAAGYRSCDDTYGGGDYGDYWSSTQNPDYSYYAYTLYFYRGYAIRNSSVRGTGQSVRPVTDATDVTENEKDEAVMSGLCPDSHHPHAIDLGIGVKWACCNVGASAPEQYGGYYAWGETEEKSYYSDGTYAFFDNVAYNNGKSYSECFKSLGSDIAGTSYDVAHVKWGGGWRMPSRDQIRLLVDNCSSEWTTLNGVKGRVFTGPNGGKIFLPAAGDHAGGVGSDGYYWSSTQYHDYSYAAYGLGFLSGDADWYGGSRYYGRSVRPATE